MKKIALILLGVLITHSPFSLANENLISTYPVSGVFLSYGVKGEEFRNLFENKNIKQMFINDFIKNYKNNFDNINSEITDKNKYKTIVSYLAIPRASKYIDKKPNGDEIYLPITMSLNFVNILTGETIYSTSATKFGKTLKDNKEEINKEYIDAYNRALFEVINKSKIGFKPFKISTKVVDSYKNVIILDKGTEVGITKDDLLVDEESNQLSIIYSTLNYSVGKNLFNSDIKNETIFNKFSLSQLNKIKVLLINDIGNETMYDLLVSNLGNDSKINLLALNPTFNNMRSSVVALNKNFSSTNIYKRNLPNYYMIFNFTPPTKTTLAHNQSGLDSEYFQLMGCGTIFDKTGKIVFAQCDNYKTNPRFTKDEYRTQDENIVEQLTKGLIENLSAKINEKIDFKEYEFRIKKIEQDSIVIEDKTEILGVGNNVTIYKKVKSNNNQEYFVPTLEYEVVDSIKGLTTCKLSYPYIDNVDKPSKSDIAKSTLIVASKGSKSFSVDTKNLELEDNSIKINGLDRIITPIIASGFKKPLSLDQEIIVNKVDSINKTGIFNKNLSIPKSNSQLIIKPQYKITLKKHKVKGYSKIDTYTILVNISTYKSDKLLTQKALSQDITLTIPLKNGDRILEYEILKTMNSLFNSISTQI